jgi:hypothetical protein
MFYMIPNPMFDNALQSWIAAARDQATAQLIATASMQKTLQSRVVHDLESCTLMVEEQVDAMCLPVEPSVARTCPTKRTRKHGL